MAAVRRPAIAAAVLALPLLAVLVAWLARTPPPVLREQLQSVQFWALELQLALVAIAAVASMRQLASHAGLTRREALAAGSIAILAVALSAGVAPETNRIYYDEHIYEAAAQNMTDLRRAQMCNEGIVEYGRLQCLRAEYNKEPYGYPHLLSVAYRLFGVSDRLPHAMNALAHGALACVVFGLALLWFDDRRAAAFAALVSAVIPQQVIWSHTAASEPTSALTAAVTMFAAAMFVRLRSGAALGFVAVAAAYAMTFRPEMPLVAIPVCAAIVLSAPEELKRNRIWFGATAALLLSIVTIAHLASVRDQGWGTGGPRFSLMFLGPNLRTNGWFYLWDARFPALLTVLALAGAWHRRSRAVVVMLLWFLAFAGIYVVFYAGSYNYGADVRYSLLTYPPIAVLAGAGAAALSRWLDGRSATAGRGAILVTAALALQTTWYLPLMRTVGEEAWAARADVAFARAAAARLPRNAVVLTHNPGMFHLWGVNAAQMSIAADQPEYVRRDLTGRFAGGVFIHWNFWCNVSDPVQNEFCRSVLSSFRTELVEESRERDYRYAFYRVIPK